MHTQERESGFTLIETLIVVAMIGILMIAGIGVALSSQPYELTAATLQFDALVDAAATNARAYGDGATIYVQPAVAGTGFRAKLYAHRPDNAQTLDIPGVPGIDSRAAITETTTLHDPAFAIVIHGSGTVGGRAAFSAGDAIAGKETPCPASGAFTFVFSVGGHTATRTLACAIDLSATRALKTGAAPVPGVAPTTSSAPCSTLVTCPPPQPGPASAIPTCPPSGATQAGVTCLYPMSVSPAALLFVTPTDTNPQVYDANGNALGTTDPGGAIAVSEQYYNAAYAIDASTCANVAGAPAATAPDADSGATFAITTTGQPTAYGNCTLAVHDGTNGQSARVNVSVAGPLQILDDSTQSPILTVDIHTDSTSIGWQNSIVDAAKQNFPQVGSASLDLGTCASFVSDQIGVSKTVGRLENEIPITLSGLKTTMNLQTNQFSPCTITVSNSLGEQVSILINVDPTLPARTPPPQQTVSQYIQILQTVQSQQLGCSGSNGVASLNGDGSPSSCQDSAESNVFADAAVPSNSKIQLPILCNASTWSPGGYSVPILSGASANSASEAWPIVDPLGHVPTGQSILVDPTSNLVYGPASLAGQSYTDASNSIETLTTYSLACP